MALVQLQPFIDRLKNHLLVYDKELQLDQYPPLNLAHEKTNLPRIYFVIGAAFLAVSIVIQIFGLSFVSNVVAFGPIYQSFKALRSEGKEDDEQWLTYWVVYGSLSLFESFIDGMLFWLPFYFIFKMAFLAWAYSPQYRGAQVIYAKILGPIFVGIEKEVEEVERSIKSRRSERESRKVE